MTHMSTHKLETAAFQLRPPAEVMSDIYSHAVLQGHVGGMLEGRASGGGGWGRGARRHRE